MPTKKNHSFKTKHYEVFIFYILFMKISFHLFVFILQNSLCILLVKDSLDLDSMGMIIIDNGILPSRSKEIV